MIALRKNKIAATVPRLAFARRRTNAGAVGWVERNRETHRCTRDGGSRDYARPTLYAKRRIARRDRVHFTAIASNPSARPRMRAQRLANPEPSRVVRMPRWAECRIQLACPCWRIVMSAKPASFNMARSVAGVKCVRWRGKSRPYQSEPNQLAASPAKFGTLTSNRPPGAQQAMSVAQDLERRVDVFERLPHGDCFEASIGPLPPGNVPA